MAICYSIPRKQLQEHRIIFIALSPALRGSSKRKLWANEPEVWKLPLDPTQTRSACCQPSIHPSLTRDLFGVVICGAVWLLFHASQHLWFPSASYPKPSFIYSPSALLVTRVIVCVMGYNISNVNGYFLTLQIIFLSFFQKRLFTTYN